MSISPDVSVVMSVYNGAPQLRQTIDSILLQEGVSFEFIIINDGSTDESPWLLEDYAKRDPRVRVIHQDNRGLTQALITGCAAARGRYIARQDVGDVSLPYRLSKQVACLRQHENAAFISCGTRFVGPGGEHLYDVIADASQAQQGLLSLQADKIRGPSHHGSTLFSRELYERVGGYRSFFYFAQDLDLWVRLGERGEHIPMPEILYQAAITVGAISGLYRKRQVETASMILESARLRRAGLDDTPVLERARMLRPGPRHTKDRREQANTFYFIGVCLKKRSHPQASSYFKQALRADPLHWKSVARLLLG